MFQKSCLPLIVFLSLSFACTRDKKPLEPEKPSAIPSTMPQVDIPWPSLADSPWPMPLRTPQAVARTHLRGPRIGGTLWEVPLAEKVLAPPVIGPDGTIYVCVHEDTSGSGLLYAVSPDGHIKWKFRPTTRNTHFNSAPIIGVDGTIYVGTYWQMEKSPFYALSPDGNIKWVLELNGGSAQYGNNIGLDGTIYTTTTKGYLQAINPNGTLKWESFGIAGFASTPDLLEAVISIAPDGNTLYLQGLDLSLNALRAEDGNVVWQKKMGIEEMGPPIVDGQGNIYCGGLDINAGSYLFSLDPSGNERWRFKYSDGFHGINSGIVMDKAGYLYFQGPGALYSLDYAGHLRWKRLIPYRASYCPILCDGESNIFTMFILDGAFRTFDLNGNMVLEKQFYANYTVTGAIGNNGVLYTSTGLHSKAINLIAMN